MSAGPHDNIVDIRDYERPAKRNLYVTEKCIHADDYKAIFPPHCNGGKPCRACTAKWDEAQAARKAV